MVLTVEEQAEESAGIFLTARTVICEDCGYIGVPNVDVCRKCASASIQRLAPIVNPEPEARR